MQKYGIIFISFVFLCKGLTYASLIPIFQNPDELVHYVTAYDKFHSFKDDTTVRNSLFETLSLISFKEITEQKTNTQHFAFQPQPTNTTEPLKTPISVSPSSSISWYYILSSKIIEISAFFSIPTQVFFIRSFSILLGLLIVITSYFLSQEIGFSKSESILLSALISFQPMFGATAAQLNIDIALVLSFTLFTLMGVTTLREDALSRKNIIFLILAMLLGIFAKGPGIVLIAISILLFTFIVWQKYQFRTKRLASFLVAIALIVPLLTFFTFPKYFSSITYSNENSVFPSPTISIAKYFQKTIDFGEFKDTTSSYWGNFGWLDTKVGNNVLSIIWIIEILGTIGLILFFIPWEKIQIEKFNGWKKNTLLYLFQKRDFLPKKTVISFLLILILALQIAIRFYDWRVFDTTGKILIGTPGRYFLPNIIPHMILLITGLGFFTGNKKQFDLLLKSLVILMLLLSLYSFFDVIIPRYYL